MNLRNLMIAIAVIVIIFSGYYLFKGDAPITNYPPKNQKIVAFGDSLIEGIGASMNNDFISVVGRNLNISIENRGKSGDTTTSALERLDDVLKEDPGILILLLGGNDVLRRIPKEETFKNLGVIIHKFQANGTLVVLLGVRGGILTDAYEEDFESLAEKYHTPFVSNVLKNIITKRELMDDSIHPNDAGYRIIAGRVTKVLGEILN